MAYTPPNDQVLRVMQELGLERLQAIRHLQAQQKAQEVAGINRAYNAESTGHASSDNTAQHKTHASIAALIRRVVAVLRRFFSRAKNGSL